MPLIYFSKIQGLFLVLSTIICISSCNIKDETNNVEFALKDSIILPFSSIGGIKLLDLDKQIFIYRQNYDLSVLNIYNEKFQKIDSVDYSEAIGEDKISSYYPHNKDSIFLVSHKSDVVYLINNKGHAIDKWQAKSKKYPQLEINPSDWIHFSDDRLYVRGYINKVSDSFQNYFPELVIHIKPKGIIDSVSNFFPTFSNVYLNGKDYSPLSDSWIDRIVDDKHNRIIYSFPVDHNLYVYNNKGLPEGTYPAKSDDITEFYITPEEKRKDFQFAMKMYSCAPNYHSLVYDAFRNLYYRIAEHAIPLENEDGTVPDKKSKTWSIIVLNEQLERLGEVKFPSNTYFNTILPMPEGVYIINHARKNRIGQKKINKNIGYADLYEIKIKK